MKLSDITLALVVVALWGFTFSVTKLALETFNAAELTFLRFALAALPMLVLPRPRAPWRMLLGIGATMFLGLFLLQFYAFRLGAPAGITAVLTQIQVPATIALAVLTMGERPTGRQIGGGLAALLGLALIAATIGGDGLTLEGFALIVASALSWSVGNVMVKRLPPVDALSLIVWISPVPALACLALGLVSEGPRDFTQHLIDASWTAYGYALFLAVIATHLGYGVWSRLLKTYPTAQVTPFALLVPFAAEYFSWLIFGERFEGLRLVGAALILAGLAVIVLPWERLIPRSR